MTATSDLRAALAAEATITNLTSSRIYGEHAPQSLGFPRILLTQLGSDELGALDGVGKYRAVTFDIDCKAATSVACDSLADAVRVFIDDFSAANNIDAVNLEGESSDYEPPTDGSETGVFVRTLDVTIFHDQTA